MSPFPCGLSGTARRGTQVAMPISLRLFLIMALLPACATLPGTADEGVSHGAIEVVLDDLHLAASEADEERYFGHFTGDAVFLGTDATERWSVEQFRAYAHPHFAAGKGWTYKATERHIRVSADGKTAWFDERLQNEKYGEVRGSGVLIRDGRWRVAHYNLSFPIPNDLAAQVIGLIRSDKPAP
jgi:ketosteroid isomerase-like protein